MCNLVTATVAAHGFILLIYRSLLLRRKQRTAVVVTTTAVAAAADKATLTKAPFGLLLRMF